MKNLFVLTEKKIVIFIVALALFLDALDSSILNTAIPAMARSLQVHPVDLKIALISYLLSLAVFIPISGWVADKFGAKRVFIFALGVFTLSSFWCGFATQLYELVIARSIQGLGGSLMLPIGRLFILRTFKRHELVEAMNAVIIVVSVGLMLGPFAGGIITDHLSWSWIFWVNIPVGIFAILLAAKFLKPIPPKKVRALDLLGFFLFGGGLAALTFALSDISESTANMTIALLIMCIAVLMLACYFLRSEHQKHPIIKMELFKIKTFRISMIGNLCSRLGFGGVPFLLPLLLQVGLHYSAQLSGLLLVPIAFGVMFVKAVAIKILRRFGFKKILICNAIFIGALLISFQIITATTSVYTIACLTFAFGLLIAMQFTAMNSLAYADIAAEDHSAATSIVSTMQQVAQSFGVAISALFLRVFTAGHATDFTLTPQIFHEAFIGLGVITLLSVFIFLPLTIKDGLEMLNVPKKGAIDSEA